MGMLSEYTFVHLHDSLEPNSMLRDYFGNPRDTVSVPVLQERYEHYDEDVLDESEATLKVFGAPIICEVEDNERLMANPFKARYSHYESDEYQADGKPVFLFVTRSPQYTPNKADRIITELIEPLVDFEGGEKLLEELGQKNKLVE